MKALSNKTRYFITVAILLTLTLTLHTSHRNQSIASHSRLVIVDIVVLFVSLQGMVCIKICSVVQTKEKFYYYMQIIESQQKRKRIWIHKINKKRNNYGEYHRLCRELESY